MIACHLSKVYRWLTSELHRDLTIQVSDKTSIFGPLTGDIFSRRQPCLLHFYWIRQLFYAALQSRGFFATSVGLVVKGAVRRRGRRRVPCLKQYRKCATDTRSQHLPALNGRLFGDLYFCSEICVEYCSFKRSREVWVCSTRWYFRVKSK